MNAYYNRKKSLHQCTACGTQDSRTLAGKTLCARCWTKQQQRMKDKIKTLTELHRCQKCGKQLKDNDRHKVCFACRLKLSEYRKQRYQEKREER